MVLAVRLSLLAMGWTSSVGFYETSTAEACLLQNHETQTLVSTNLKNKGVGAVGSTVPLLMTHHPRLCMSAAQTAPKQLDQAENRVKLHSCVLAKLGNVHDRLLCDFWCESHDRAWLRRLVQLLPSHQSCAASALYSIMGGISSGDMKALWSACTATDTGVSVSSTAMHRSVLSAEDTQYYHLISIARRGVATETLFVNPGDVIR